MRFLAFTLLAFAAFDWPLPWVDRLGAAALGVGFLALAVSPGGYRRGRPASMAFPFSEIAGRSDRLDADSDLAQRIAAYEP